MLTKKKTTNADTASNDGETTSAFRDNADINTKIDTYIQQNPKYMEYLKTMPRERLERAMVLHQVQKQERQQKLDQGVLRKLDSDPELKQTLQNLVKDLPEGQREKALIQIAGRTMRDIGFHKSRAQGAVKV